MIISIDETKLHEYLKQKFKEKILDALRTQVSNWDYTDEQNNLVKGWNSQEGLWDGFNNGSPIDPYNKNNTFPTTLSWKKGWLHISHDSDGYPSRWWYDQSNNKKVGRRSLATGVSANVVDDKLSIEFVYKIINRADNAFPEQ